MAKRAAMKASVLGFAWMVSGCTPPEPVNDQVTLDVGDTQVFLEIAGPDRDAPLILFLHGGPGSVAHLVMFQETVGKQLEQDFLVAYLHQRGVGRSSPLASEEQSISAHVNDVEQIVEYLTQSYQKDEVHLVGHSWGGMLAARFAVEHGERIERLVLISTATNVKSLLRDSYEGVLGWAYEENMSEAIAELTALDQSFNTIQHFGVVLGWADRSGGIADDFDVDAFLSNHAVNVDYPDWREREGTINGAMIPEVIEFDVSNSFSSLDLPVLFVSGAMDPLVTETTMRRDYENYSGEKLFVRLEESHHLPFIDQPDELLQSIRTFLSE
jgi:pimeloyl-ACP methyl ester carboxylesterase